MRENNKEIRRVTISEVKNILKKVNKDRDELSYEQRTALEHAQKFAKLTIKQTNDLIKDLINLDFLEESHAFKIVDLLPNTEEDIKTIFAKERISLGNEEIKKIINIIDKYCIK